MFAEFFLKQLLYFQFYILISFFSLENHPLIVSMYIRVEFKYTARALNDGGEISIWFKPHDFLSHLHFLTYSPNYVNKYKV